MGSRISTRFLVLSDTHGDEPELPQSEFDVVLHCGDLTEESNLDEYRTTLQWLKRTKAPLKLVIAGNHDFALDIPSYRRKFEEAKDQGIGGDQLKRTFGDIGAARALFESPDAKASGIVLLDEGIHHFKLANGASLTVYASPYTPATSEGGFTFHPERDHDWNIENGVDVVMTHGPPRGILDYTDSKTRAGWPSLFSAITRARPQLHCFGHIHEGWGAKRVTWRDDVGDNPSHFTAIDNEQSEVIETLASIRPRKHDTDETRGEKQAKLRGLMDRRYCQAMGPIQPGSQTMFINAAIHGDLDYQMQLPWTVDIELPSDSGQAGQAKRTATDASLALGDVDEGKKRLVAGSV